MKQKAEKFTERLRALRTEKGANQAEMGALLGCSMRSYYRLERGEVNATTAVLITLADYFDVTIDYLVGRSEER